MAITSGLHPEDDGSIPSGTTKNFGNVVLMVTRVVWDHETQFESDVSDQNLSPHSSMEEHGASNATIRVRILVGIPKFSRYSLVGKALHL